MADDPPISQSEPDSDQPDTPSEPDSASEPDSNQSSAADQARGGPIRRFIRRHPRLEIALDEFKALEGDSDRHKRLHGRLIGILIVSVVLDALIALLLFKFDSFSDKEPGHSLGKAFAWTSSQMLVGGSSYATQTPIGHIAEVALQAYGVTVIAALAGSFTSFFLSADNPAPTTPSA